MMASVVAQLLPTSVSSNCIRRNHRQVSVFLPNSSEAISSFPGKNSSNKGARHQIASRVPTGLPPLPRRRRRRRGSLAVVHSRLNATDLRIVDTTTTTTTNSKNDGDTLTKRTVVIPVTCYQIIGVRDRAEKDEIVKSVMELKNAEIEEGYTMDAVVSCQNLLMDVRDKLLFEPEYAGNLKEKVPPKSTLCIPWAWLPGALCLLQEVGEEELVLDIGRAALQHPDAKPYIHDVLLSMALAECGIATVSFEKNNISQGFEALARAQCLLRSKISLGKMKLLSQIEESLEELAPACTLELLGMPLTPENAERRIRAIAALRELLRQGLDVEAQCQVQDWPCFLSQALNKLIAAEIVNLLPWDSLAVTRKNKKSLESQNQRVVIDFNCFFMAMMAHIALGFSSKQMDLINKARTICECLIASEGVDLKFEEAFCLFLLGQADESEAVERLQQLELNSDPTLGNSESGKDIKGASSTKQSLEKWLMDNVLGLFPDTRDCSPSLFNFFSGEKRGCTSRQIRGSPQTIPSISQRPISPALVSDQRALEDPLSHTNSTRHIGLAVKQLAPANLQDTLIAGKNNNESNGSIPSVQLKRSIGMHRDKIWQNWLNLYVVGKITFVMALGCVLFAALKLSAFQLWKMKSPTRLPSGKTGIYTSSHVCTKDSSLDQSLASACMMGNSIAYRLKKLLSVFRVRLGNYQNAANLQSSCRTAKLSSSVTVVYKKPMPVEEAESLVKQWQAIKAEALGPSHQVHSLFQVLDGPMLVQWHALADAAKARSCFWRFVLLKLSVVRAEILSDAIGAEMAEIEALLEEAAELVDESQPKNPNYYSTYRIHYFLKRQDDDSWRFCEGDIQTT
ncbi:plastid division protein CDP1, chloroplastic [Diospyros lotus]|uniref:plastid division protein CDP1, chloroplastic n=1 Tax=Diospyros lotus TaxID=55363 RepID=UPI00225A1B43|nr:plastid division protein CDP1, chloroplastic [Diospyros lotus]